MVDLVLEDIEMRHAGAHPRGRAREDGPVVAPLLEYTGDVDGGGNGDPLTTRSDVPLIEGTVVDDPELVEAILNDPGRTTSTYIRSTIRAERFADRSADSTSAKKPNSNRCRRSSLSPDWIRKIPK